VPADGSQIDDKTAVEIERQIKGFGENIKSLDTDTRKSLGEMRALIDGMPKAGDIVTSERVDKFAAEVETKQNAIETNLTEIQANLDKVATAVNRGDRADWKGGKDGGDEAAYQFMLAKMANNGSLKVGAKIEPNKDEIRAWNENFALYMRRDDKGGAHALHAAFQAALQTGSDPDGGYLVPTETSKRIVEKAYETSPMSDVAFTETIGGKELEVPRDEAEAGAGWVGETEARPETTTPTLGMSKIVAHEMYAAPRATQNMLEDAGVDIEAWLARKVGEKFGRLEASAFLTGDGVGKPRGLLTYASGTAAGQIERLNSLAATDFTFDGLQDAVFALKDPYEANASWLINRLGLRNISKLKDGEGRYIWDMNNVKDKTGRSLLLGYPVRRATDISVPGAGNIMAAFGDFKQAYTIVRRLGITTLRDPYTQKPYVIFYSRARVGGDVVNFEAVKLVVGSASANP
jgi:HK97 family phage major capsid protein